MYVFEMKLLKTPCSTGPVRLTNVTEEFARNVAEGLYPDRIYFFVDLEAPEAL